MKIAFIGQKGIPAQSGGVERCVEDIATRLVAQGEQVMVYTRNYYTPKALRFYQGVRLICLPSIRTKHLDAITHSFLASLHAVFSGATVIHFQSIGPALLCWLPKLLNPKIKIVSTLQSRDYEHQKWNGLARLILKLGERSMCFFSDDIIVVTRLMENYVREKYQRQATYVPNGANDFEAVGQELIERWGLAKDNYIVAVARLIPHKGLHYLIQAYQNLKSVDKKLVIVGDGSFTDAYVRELKNSAAGDSRIIFTGNQTGRCLAQLYANAYIFVQPSQSEGLSLALLEAMGRAVPVLVSDIAENLEAVGSVGFVFVNKNVADLTKQLCFLLDNPDLLKERAVAGILRVKREFNWDRLVKILIDVYKAPVVRRLLTRKSAQTV